MPVTVDLTARRRAAIEVYEVDVLDGAFVEVFVTGRVGGVSTGAFATLNLGAHVGDQPEHVAENRRRVADAAGVAPSELITAHQVHGADVALVDAASADLTADALVTDDPTVAIAVLVADCVPVLIASPAGRVGVAHAGWRGLAGGVLARAMEHFGDAGDVRVLLGPSVAAVSYPVGPEVATFFDDVPGALARSEGDRSLLDLRAVAAHQLRSLGVADANILVAREVTSEAGAFFSDRARRPCGRFALVARRRSMRSP